MATDEEAYIVERLYPCTYPGCKGSHWHPDRGKDGPLPLAKAQAWMEGLQSLWPARKYRLRPALAQASLPLLDAD